MSAWPGGPGWTASPPPMRLAGFSARALSWAATKGWNWSAKTALLAAATSFTPVRKLLQRLVIALDGRAGLAFSTGLGVSQATRMPAALACSAMPLSPSM